MNLRILKKLSKKAVPYLQAIEPGYEIYPAEKDDSYISGKGFPRKNWCRTRVPNSPRFAIGTVSVVKTRDNAHILMREPSHPIKGTMMAGMMSGYYEPEWSENSAWETLRELMLAHFTDWHPDREPVLLRPLETVSDVFAAAQDFIDAKQAA